MNVLYLVASGAFYVWFIRNLLFWIWVMQQHDYQFKRIRNYLQQTFDGRRVWLSSVLIIKIVAIAAFIPTIFNDNFLPLYYSCVTAIFLFHVGQFVKELAIGTSKLPRITPLVFFFLVPTLFVIVLFYYNPIIDQYLWLLLLDRLLIIILALLYFAFSFPSEIYWDIQITAARKKMRSLQHCYVIAVVGDGGKKPTVDMIAQIFSKEKGILAVSKTVVTRKYLAWVINTKVTPETRMIVTRFDSFAKDDLYELSQLLQPNTIVCTSLAARTLRDYYHFFHRIPESVPILVPGSIHAKKIRGKHRRVILYSEQPISAYAGESVIVTALREKKTATYFSVKTSGKVYHLTSPLIGSYSVRCLLPAFYLGLVSGIPAGDMRQLVASLQPTEQHMIPYTLQSGAVVIDNSGASDVDAVASSLHYMRLYPGKKVLVHSTPSMVLSLHKEEQYTIAKIIAQVCDHLFLINRYYQRNIMHGLFDSNSKCVVTYSNKYTISQYIHNSVRQKGDIVLFSGRGSERIFSFVINRIH